VVAPNRGPPAALTALTLKAVDAMPVAVVTELVETVVSADETNDSAPASDAVFARRVYVVETGAPMAFTPSTSVQSTCR